MENTTKEDLFNAINNDIETNVYPKSISFIGREIMGYPLINDHIKFLDELADEKDIFRIKIRNKETGKITVLYGAKSLESQVG
jgi:hypothetical protein